MGVYRGRSEGGFGGASGALLIRLFFYNPSQPKTLRQNALSATNFFAPSAPFNVNCKSPLMSREADNYNRKFEGDDSMRLQGFFRDDEGRAGDVRGSSGGRMGDEIHATSCYNEDANPSNTTTCQSAPPRESFFPAPFPPPHANPCQTPPTRAIPPHD